MTKKEYMQPAMNVVELSRKADIVTISEVNGNVFDGYYQDGDNPYNAW